MSDTDGSKAIGKSLEDVQAVGNAAREIADRARQAGASAIDQARDVAGDAKDRATSLASAVGDRASAVAENQKETLAARLEDVATAVHRSGEQLDGHQDWIAHLVKKGADELSGIATTLRTNDLQSLLGELGGLARRQPALFIGASMVAGFALTRIGRVAVSAPPAATSSASDASDERK